jgi:hypothetical protein
MSKVVTKLPIGQMNVELDVVDIYICCIYCLEQVSECTYMCCGENHFDNFKEYEDGELKRCD